MTSLTMTWPLLKSNLLKSNPLVGTYRGACILLLPDGWISYYPSTSNHVIASGSEQQRQQAVNKARQLIDRYLSANEESSGESG